MCIGEKEADEEKKKIPGVCSAVMNFGVLLEDL